MAYSGMFIVLLCVYYTKELARQSRLRGDTRHGLIEQTDDVEMSAQSAQS